MFIGPLTDEEADLRKRKSFLRQHRKYQEVCHGKCPRANEGGANLEKIGMNHTKLKYAVDLSWSSPCSNVQPRRFLCSSFCEAWSSGAVG